MTSETAKVLDFLQASFGRVYDRLDRIDERLERYPVRRAVFECQS